MQTYVLTGKDGSRLAPALAGTPIKGLTPDGYLLAEFRCHTFGISSPGGCHVEPDDETEWRPVP